MGPESPLPLPTEFSDADTYIESLLNFATSSWLLQTLCGGVHILDFYTRSPDLYSTTLPEDWRVWFKGQDIMDILDLFMREDLQQFDFANGTAKARSWRGGSLPPKSLVQYVGDVRKHLLCRTYSPPDSNLLSRKSSIARHVSVGMKVKKVHEVGNFAHYVDRLTSELAETQNEAITHIVDFGSGQNYLGRALAAQPYSKHMIAVESKPHNIEGAKNMDILAKLVPKPLVMRNKKEYRAELRRRKEVAGCSENGCAIVSPVTSAPQDQSSGKPNHRIEIHEQNDRSSTITTHLQIYTDGQGSVQYVKHRIEDGDLAPVINQILDSSQVQKENIDTTSAVIEEAADLNAVPKQSKPNLLVISLHSCGNLVHHGLRSLLLNPSISAVAMIGCCYNLVTERLGPPTYKLPSLRPNHPRLISTANAFDPHGFPMSEHLANFPVPHPPLAEFSGDAEAPKGLRLNITARMMAVQAPQNWGIDDSEIFFTRHFYRALLQRIFLDRGVVSAPVDTDSVVGGSVSAVGHTSKVNWTPPNGRGPGLSSDGNTTPLTIGTLRKFAYKDFVSYVRAALGKLTTSNTFCEVDPEYIKDKMNDLTDEEITCYENKYKEKKKELSIMWSLMAYSAGVVEAIIVVDRWLWLKEQDEVEKAWVEPVFDYGVSPRNLVVVGLKKPKTHLS